MRDMPNLDFVRSVAVISVVVEHTLLALGILKVGPFPIESMGVLGVLIFFVLTALVLMWSLERKPHTLDFYIRRWFRIYPLALAVILMALLFHAPTGGTPQHIFAYVHPSWKNLLIQAAQLQDVQDNKLVSVMWSLPYEVQMYVLLPMVYFFVRKNFSLWPLLLMWALIVFDTWDYGKGGHNFAMAIAYFLPGVMAYVAFGRWKPRFPGWLLPVFLAVLWPVFLAHFNFHNAWYFCLIVGLGLPLFRQMTSKWVLAPSKQIAKYSYGVYLTHPFAIVIGMYLLHGYSLPVRLVAEAVPLVVFPVLAYHFIEHPMIRLGSRLAAKAEKRYEQHEMKQFREEPAA